MKYWLLIFMSLGFVQTGATLAHTVETETSRPPIPLTQEERAWLDENQKWERCGGPATH